MKRCISAIFFICLQSTVLQVAFAKTSSLAHRTYTNTDIPDWAAALGLIEDIGYFQLDPDEDVRLLQSSSSCEQATKQISMKSIRMDHEHSDDLNRLTKSIINNRREQNPAWKAPVDPEIEGEILQRANNWRLHLERAWKYYFTLSKVKSGCASASGTVRLLRHELDEMKKAIDFQALKKLSETINSRVRPLPSDPIIHNDSTGGPSHRID